MGVIGLGHFAQAAILPAFRYLDDVELVALVSGSPKKRAELGARYEVDDAIDYAELPALYARGALDAVYVATPPDTHAAHTIDAARAGVHVLCEQPMAPTEAECGAMIAACEDARVRLAIAYRLHFEAANLTAIELVQGGKLGAPRIFSSVFTRQVRTGNVRTQPRPGAGPLHHLGVSCINAARYLFRDEPREVVATSFTDRKDPRFAHVDEAVGAILRFPGDRCAIFATSFGAHDRAHYQVVCTEGLVTLDHAYDHEHELRLSIENGVPPRTRTFQRRDQVAATIEDFARCVRDGLEPEPSGHEGRADVRIIEAIQRSAAQGGAAIAIDPLRPVKRTRWPDLQQEIRVPPHGDARLVEVA